MAKKFSLFMTTVAVLAFAIPAMASAAPSVTSKAGVLAPKGMKITGTNVGHVLTTGTPFGTLTCAKVTLSGELTENTGTKVTGKAGTGTVSECNVNGSPLTTTNITVTHLESTVAGSGKASFTYVSDTAGGITCDYIGTNVPFTYVPGSSHITFKEATGINGPGFCAAPNIRFDATFALEIGSTAVILD